MALTPPAITDGPERGPLPGGLFSAATVRTNDAPYWQGGGARWVAQQCDPVSGVGEPCEDGQAEPPVIDSVDPNSGPVEGGTEITVTGSGFLAADGTGPEKTPVPGSGLADATPFTLYGSTLCSPVGNTADDAEGRALAHLLTREEAAAEHEAWTGDLGSLPSLDDDPTVLAGGAAVDPVVALALLEQHIADEYGSVGVIHMTRAAALLASGRMIERSGRLTTRLGTPVAAGAGYPGTGPDGAEVSDGQVWAYASPAVLVLRSETFTNSALDRSTNDLLALAERTYAIGWDPCPVGAVLIDLGLPAAD